MREFEVGDRVRLTRGDSGYSGIEAGVVTTVLEVDPGSGVVQVDVDFTPGVKAYVHKEDLELVPQVATDGKSEVEIVRDQLARTLAEFEKFKLDVAIKARDLANEHDWCDVVKDALEDLGLKWPSVQREIRVEVEMLVRRTFTVTLEDTGELTDRDGNFDAVKFQRQLSFDGEELMVEDYEVEDISEDEYSRTDDVQDYTVEEI